MVPLCGRANNIQPRDIANAQTPAAPLQDTDCKSRKARGSAPAPRWGLRPQTPILFVPSPTPALSHIADNCELCRAVERNS